MTITKNNYKNKGELEVKTIRLFKGDVDIINSFYPNAGYNVVIRMLVHNLVKKLLATTNSLENIDGTDITLDITLAGSIEGQPE